MLPRSPSQAGVNAVPRGRPLSRVSQFNALFALLLWLRSVLAVRPTGAWWSLVKLTSYAAVAGRDQLGRPIHGLGYLP
jgi:hypothetical protein